MIIANFRKKVGPIITALIIGFIAFIFIFLGAFNPDPGAIGAIAGRVNGEVIPLGDFNRALEQRMQFFNNMGGGKLTAEQLKMFRIHESVFNELASRKLMVLQARKMGLTPTDSEVRQEIEKLPYFKDGDKFDRLKYRQLLEANHLTVASFERQVREDLMVQQWRRLFGMTAHVTQLEIEEEFKTAEESRKVRYAYIPMDLARKELKGNNKEEPKSEAIQVRLEAMGAEWMKLVSGPVAAAEAAAKKQGVRFSKEQPVSVKEDRLPAVTGSDEFLKEAFSGGKVESSPVFQKPKKYSSGAGILVAMVVGGSSADLSKLDSKKRAEYQARMTQRKGNELMQSWTMEMMKSAKIEPSKAVMNSEG